MPLGLRCFTQVDGARNGGDQSRPIDARDMASHCEALRHEIPRRSRPKWAGQRSCLGWITRRLGNRATLPLFALLEPITLAIHL
jgi:hypothetical protein